MKADARPNVPHCMICLGNNTSEESQKLHSSTVEQIATSEENPVNLKFGICEWHDDTEVHKTVGTLVERLNSKHRTPSRHFAVYASKSKPHCTSSEH